MEIRLHDLRKTRCEKNNGNDNLREIVGNLGWSLNNLDYENERSQRNGLSLHWSLSFSHFEISLVLTVFV